MLWNLAYTKTHYSTKSRRQELDGCLTCYLVIPFTDHNVNDATVMQLGCTKIKLIIKKKDCLKLERSSNRFSRGKGRD